MENPDLRVEGRGDALLAISLAIMRGNVKIRGDTSHDDDHSHSKGIFNDRRNDRYNGKGKRNAGHHENGRFFNKAWNSRYDESNAVSDKAKLVLSYVGPLHWTLWEIVLLIVMPQGTSPDIRKHSLI